MSRGRPREKPTPIKKRMVHFCLEWLYTGHPSLATWSEYMEPTETALIARVSGIVNIAERHIELRWDKDDELDGGEFRSKGELLGRFDVKPN